MSHLMRDARPIHNGAINTNKMTWNIVTEERILYRQGPIFLQKNLHFLNLEICPFPFCTYKEWIGIMKCQSIVVWEAKFWQPSIDIKEFPPHYQFCKTV